MRSKVLMGLAGLGALGIVAGTLAFRNARETPENRRAPAETPAPAPRPTRVEGPSRASVEADKDVPLFSDGFLDDSGYSFAVGNTGPVKDQASIAEVRGAVRHRGRLGIAALKAQIDGLRPTDPRRFDLGITVGLLHMYDGEFLEALPWLNAYIDNPALSPATRANIQALRGVASLRRGEVANCVACVGPSSCLFPIAPEAVHRRPEGSRAAIRDFTAYLALRPDDLGVRWLLNVAYMTLGEYPAKVPPALLIPLDVFKSKADPGRFENVGLLVGLETRGENMFGGSLFDDFDGDGLADLFLCSNDCDLGASLFINRGDGTFEDRGTSYGLGDQALAPNARQADFDNDGRLDILMLRGGWEAPARLSLLRNTGTAFEDVTVASGLGVPTATESAAWGDYDNDGRLDLYVAGETRGNRSPDPRNLCRLYHNEGGGKFVDVAARAGVENRRWTKGVAWGDYDADGRLDLYVSNLDGLNRLYHNNGDGTFTDLAERLGVAEPLAGFSCWFWDFDNDGRLDLFVSGYRVTLNDYVKDLLGQPTSAERPRLFRNLGPDGFRDVTRDVGLDRVWMPMGSNFADIDNDGYLDVYLGTGLTSYSSLVPNVMLKNLGGERFEDVTVATGTGHLQKGHGISFADWDGDGDLDLFVEIGGSVPGDRGHNALFQNPGHGRHWLALKLVGTRTNRSALGASVRVDCQGPDGKPRSVYRQVGSGSSYGGNSLVVHVGLGDARKARTVAINWPGSQTTQTFHDVNADQLLEITEGRASYQPKPVRRLEVPKAPR